MKRISTGVTFDTVKAIGLTMRDVEATTRYDGSAVLKVRGAFLAGIATHPSAEPDSLVVRMNVDERESLLEDAPDTYYVTDFYRPYPIVLVRLARIDRDALHDLLSVSFRLTEPKARPRRRARGRDGGTMRRARNGERRR